MSYYIGHLKLDELNYWHLAKQVKGIQQIIEYLYSYLFDAFLPVFFMISCRCCAFNYLPIQAERSFKKGLVFISCCCAQLNVTVAFTKTENGPFREITDG